MFREEKVYQIVFFPSLPVQYSRFKPNAFRILKEDKSVDWIIVIDDDVANLKMTGTILSRHNMRATALKSGPVALDYIRKNGFPDLILLDINMPGMDGFSTLEALRREMPPEHEVPVIFLTAEEGHMQEVRALEAGAVDYIRKPFEPEVLVSRIRRVLERRGDASRPGAGPEQRPEMTLKTISAILEGQVENTGSLWAGRDAFSSIYRYMLRYIERYHSSACRILLTVRFPQETDAEHRLDFCRLYARKLRATLRGSDIMLECGENQFFLLLPEIRDYDVDRVIARLVDLGKPEDDSGIRILWEYDQVSGGSLEKPEADENIRHVAVVDDDRSNLLFAESILLRQNLKVTTLSSGTELLDMLRTQKPDLILLDMMMPDPGGLETFRRMRKEFENDVPPVIFLTAGDGEDLEAQCLELGAMDFIRKPFLPDVLSLRVRHTLELIGLQKGLSDAVARKTKENESLSLHVVQTLAEAIDAKDRYTNGHSARVAKYSVEIGRRFGYSRKQQEDLYMMGLLHDVGKIGIPDSVINKPDRLTEEEFALIREHPVMGSRILEKIREVPKLSVGARWHHERYDGTGYPDGLVGTAILEEARIIAVADAYDAMTSYRSYRKPLTQEAVRKEIENGRGTQFDPVFAEIMLQIIDDDPDFRLREI